MMKCQLTALAMLISLPVMAADDVVAANADVAIMAAH